MTKFCAKITSIGNSVNDFLKEDMLIVFSKTADETLKDISAEIKVRCINSEILPNDILTIGSYKYKVIYVGESAYESLKKLGHCTFVFNKRDELLPGQIALSGEKPEIQVGDIIEIYE